MTLLSTSDASVQFGADTLFTGVTFTVAAGDRWGVIGRNGTGKTTLFRLLTGEAQPTGGVVSRQPGVRVSLLEQHRDFGDAKTVWDAAAGAFSELLALERSLEEMAHDLADTSIGQEAHDAVLATYARDLERFQHEDGYTIVSRVDSVLLGMAFDPDEAKQRPLEALSGGERGRLALARQLVSPAEVLLLDEPTNHLDLDTTLWLEKYLLETRRTVMMISHDRAFLSDVVDHILHFEAGTAVPYGSGYSEFVRQRGERHLTQERQFSKQQKSVAAEEDYIRRNIAGQNTAQAKGRRKKLERLPRLSPPPSAEAVMSLRLEAAERGPDRVVIAAHASVNAPGAPDRLLLEDFTATLHRGERVGLIGMNGAGKSTLLHAMVAELPHSGTLRLGSGVRVAVYRQDLAQVPMDRTVYDVINDLRPLWERGMIQGHLGRFGFSGDEVRRRTSTLSGGERARLALAMIMLSHANLLVLDEPTNHLDVETVEALEDAVDAYDGSVLLVSHDRELLRGMTTRVWSLRDERITDFDGSFGEWEEARDARDREKERDAKTKARDAQVAQKHASKHATSKSQNQTVAKRGQPRHVRAGGALTPGAAAADRRADERVQRSAVRKATDDAARLEREIAELETRVATLSAMLADSGAFAGRRSSEAVSKGTELAQARAKLDDSVTRWTAAMEVIQSAAPER